MIRQLLGSGFMLVMLAGLAGCASDGPDRSQIRSKYPTYPENIRKAIDNGVVLKGMTQEQVILAIGDTPCIDSRVMGGTALDSWTYRADPYTGKLSRPGRCPGNHPVIFEGGYVIEGQTE